MARQWIVAGNWKMYKTPQETVSFIQTLSPMIASARPQVFLAVPYTSLTEAVKAAKKSNIIIGAQNMNDASEGAFTGEIAGKMLVACGCEFVILGHSERRKIFGESNTFINHKVVRAIKDGLIPILCIGETKSEQEEGLTHSVLEEQLTKCLYGVSIEDVAKVVIAYEPVWAIGTGKTATATQAKDVHHFIRKTLAKLYDKATADKISIIYGGSVKADNIAEFAKEKEIDGVLIGGASLTVESFAQIINKI